MPAESSNIAKSSSTAVSFVVVFWNRTRNKSPRLPNFGIVRYVDMFGFNVHLCYSYLFGSTVGFGREWSYRFISIRNNWIAYALRQDDTG